MLIENARIVTGMLLACECIQVAADWFDALSNFFNVSLLGSLEDHMLDEVRYPVVCRNLISWTGLKPKTKRQRSYMRNFFRNDANTIGKNCFLICRIGFMNTRWRYQSPYCFKLLLLIHRTPMNNEWRILIENTIYDEDIGFLTESQEMQRTGSGA